MPPRKAPTPELNEVTELRAEIADLRQHIRVLIDVMDGIREELSWLARNGVPREEPLAPIPVLKQMAADPCDPRWGEKLVIVRGDERRERQATPDLSDDEGPETPAVESPPSSARRPELAEFLEGDAVEFQDEGRDGFGEIVAIDAARDTATVMLVPSGEHIDVPLGRLELVLPEDEEDPSEIPVADSTFEAPPHESDPAPVVSQGLPPAGMLFADPGAQKRLF